MSWLRILVLGMLGGLVATQEPASIARLQQEAAARIGTGQETLFAFNGYTFMELIRLKPDGTFARYSRQHMFVGIADEGRWRQLENGTVLLCSHYQYNLIEAGALSVALHEGDTSKLPALVSAIERQVFTQPSTIKFAPDDLKPIDLHSWLDFERALPPGSISPRILTLDETASRTDLLALIAAIRVRLTNRDGTLTTLRLIRHAGLMWLGGPSDDVEMELMEEYRRHTGGAFLSGVAPVTVDAKTFEELLGSTQAFVHHPEMNDVLPRRAELEDLRRERLQAPECGPHDDLARPLGDRGQAAPRH